MRIAPVLSFMPLPLMVIIMPPLGLGAGLIISKLASEERKPGKTYFNILRRVLLLMLAFVLLWKATAISTASIAFFLTGILISFLPYTRYISIGAVMAGVLALPSESIILVTSLATIYGLPYASQAQPKKMSSSLLLHTGLYILPFLLTATPIFSNLQLLAAFAAGMLVNGK